ncbi:CFAP57 [Symbiodinium natans]|uniref:CFAP57 protein n=1 Tax=Symbiodinium natans TaxID=878477 RepID=A0A812U2L6_9DINO|nr:CFAP57 [Symbiodinium natans]
MQRAERARRPSVDPSSAVERATAGVSLEVLHGFGSHGRNLRDAVLFGDIAGQYLTQAVGRQLAFRHLLGDEVSFAAESCDVEAITACAASRSRAFLAVCQVCRPNRSQVSIYELGPVASNRPVQTLQELNGRDGPVGQITAVAFSSASQASGVPEDESSRLAVASMGLHAQIIVLDWRLNEIISRFMLQDELSRIDFNPLDSDMMSGSSVSSFEIFLMRDLPIEEEGEERLESKEMFKLQQIDELAEFAMTLADHAWLVPANGRLALASEEGVVFIVASGLGMEEAENRAQHLDVDPVPYFVCQIAAPFGHKVSEQQIFGIRPFINGFVVAGAKSQVAVWKLEQEENEGDGNPIDMFAIPKYAHECTATIDAGKGFAVASLDLVGGRDEVHCAVCFDSSDITHFRLGALMECNGRLAETPLLGGGFHPGPVTCMDMALQRPILVTVCSQDASLRVWDYEAGRCELCWQAPEEPTGLALHPFGFFVAVSFSDRIRFLEILAKDLKLFSELHVKNVHLLRFSNGGHLLAAAQSKLIMVFSTRSLKKIATLRGHPREVASMAFDPLDRTLVTLGEDGKVCEWSTENWSALNEYGAHGEAMAVATAGEGLVWAGVAEGDKSSFRTFHQGVHHESEDFAMHVSEHLFSMQLYSRPSEVSILAGDRSGNLRAFCGLTGSFRSATLGLHSDAITAVCISADGHTVATAGRDGAMFVLAADGISDTTRPDAKSREGSMEVVMINRGDIQLRQDEIQDLTTQISTLKAQIEEDAARLQSECRARVEEARRQDQEKIHSLRNSYETLQQASTVKERDSLRKMKAMQALHVQAADDQEKAYDKRMRADAESYDALEAARAEDAERFEQARQKAQRSLEVQEQKQEKEVHRRLNEKDAEIHKLKDLIAFTQKRFDAMLDQEGMEQSLEISEIKKKNQEELEQQHLVEYKLKKDQDMLMRGLEMMEKDRDRIAMEQREASVSISNLRTEAETMKREVTLLKAERKEREVTLRDKEMEIGAHKLKVQTLKKFKHVLDYRLREVTESLKPKEDMIAQLHLQLSALEEEFERQLEIQKQMESALEAKSAQVAQLTAEAEKQKEILKQRERTIFRYSADLLELAADQDIRNWHIGLKKLWRDHVNPETFKKDEEHSLPMQELGRQIQARTGSKIVQERKDL